MELLPRELMKNRIFQLTVLCVALTVAFAAPLHAQEGSDTVEQKEWKRTYKIHDLLVVRPIGFVLTAAGAGLWAVTLPFTMISGDSKEASDLLIAEPAKMAFGPR